MSLDVRQFRAEVVRPTLVALGLHSDAAEDLLVGTALVESRLRYLRQIGGGPALGVFQMEPATHDDIQANYLAHRARLRDAVAAFRAPAPRPDSAQLATNLAYATAMCRVHYYRRPEALPAHGDVAGYAAYWKAHYNTALGAGTPEKFIEAWNANIDGD
jgi:hypothetical protein